LREYVPVELSPAELGEKLTMAGLEVEGIIDLGASYRSLKVGQILKIDSHPKADNLLICKVKVSDGEVTILTAAKNLKIGDKVPLVLAGSSLPDGQVIQDTEFHGVVSQGMFCSEEELGLARKSEGIMVLSAETDLKADLASVLGLDDYVLVLELTPNRSDCYGMLGVAREVAALTGLELKLPEFTVEETDKPIKDLITVELEAPDLCPRYAGRVFYNIKIGESPLWLKVRLLAAGMRPINNLVDITNYVMLELNQPLHAFDLAKVEDSKIIVRRAKDEEIITTLDGEERNLNQSNLVIADAKEAQCIAGVMGGFDSEVSHSTEAIFLESAYFSPVSVRRTAQNFALRSEAAIRFGKGLDPETVPQALDRVAFLVSQLGIARVASGVIDNYPQSVQPRKIWFRPEKINAILGTDLRATYMIETFKRLNFELEEKSDDGRYKLSIPSYRLDIEGEADLAEEVARLYGYNLIPTTFPSSNMIGKLTPEQKLEEKAREILFGLGLSEIKTYSFHGEKMFDRLNIPEDHVLRKTVRMKIPLSEEGSMMRTTLLGGVLESISYNAKRNLNDLQIFEIAHLYFPTGEDSLPEEPLYLAGGLSGRAFEIGWNQSNREVDFYDGKGVLERLLDSLRVSDSRFRRGEHPSLHPGRTAILECSGKPIGVVGEVHPKVKAEFGLTSPVILFEINLQKLWLNVQKGVINVKPLPKFPPLLRDLALVLPEKVTVEEVVNLFQSVEEERLESINLFDIYQGENIKPGYRSMAFSLTFRMEDRTLQDEEVNSIMEKLIEEADLQLGAQVRK
jgi:phenylalanyl-tRNA synthetase beta chain